MRDFKFEGSMYQWEKVAWIEGAQTILENLHKTYTCIIATSADHSDTNDMIQALQRVGANIYFHHFFSQKELGFKKPDVRFFEEVVRQSNKNAKECVMIGNSYEMDIIGAKKAGLTTIFFNEAASNGLFLSADFVVNKLIEIPPILK